MLPFTADKESKRSFITAYQEAFAGPPYFETYTEQVVLEEVLTPHLEQGLVMVVTDLENDGKLVGFGCAMPYRHSPEDVQSFLEEVEKEKLIPEEFDYRRAWYMSELGVLDDYRGLGTAWELVLQRMQSVSHNGAHQFFMRTAAQQSNSLLMYLRSGARALPLLHELVEVDSESKQRVYLWGNCGESIKKISVIRDKKGYPPFAAYTETLGESIAHQG